MYDIFITSSARKSVKKLSDDVRLEIVMLCEGYIAKHPFDTEKLKKPLNECRSFHFKMNNIHYRIAYKIMEEKNRIDIILVGVRENFYQRLKRILK